MKNSILLALFPLAIGCTTIKYSTWLEQKYEPEKSGAIAISLDSQRGLEKRQDDAELKMSSFCTPKKPKVTSKRYTNETSGAVLINNVALNTRDYSMVLFFVCE